MFYHLKHGQVFKTMQPCPQPKKETETVTIATTDNQQPKNFKGTKGKGKFLKKTPSFADRIRILKWLEARKEELLAERPRYDKVAEDIRKELQIDASGQTIRYTAKAGGIHWREIGMRSESGKKHVKNPTKNQTRDAVILLKRRVNSLLKALQVLYARLGERMPPEIIDGNEGLWPVGTEISEEKLAPSA